ncbi:ubiquitin carboxyl-terminal hydrolase 8-like [Amphibalanus amphitrite]|uniref:ubiquitin carboxyl-terminal hydrolase 8-like n=1 Tax=Amphibalanus amphitrite TaxID=1232801 RepID=UPI001C914A4F|nr:ubiquitin carboxyl-terminal hydrolase 8-like [Amphibalanus amphitrite]
MSLSTGKPIKSLYMATSLDGLDSFIYRKLDLVKGAPARTCCATADTVYKSAAEALRAGDEERAFVLFMRYMEIHNQIRSKPEYKKDEKYYNSLLGMKKFEQALGVCERLQTDLKNRYALRLEEEEAKKLIEKQERLAKQEKHDKAAARGGGKAAVGKSASHTAVIPPAADATPSPAAAAADVETTISCTALNSLIKQESTSYLIVDVRPAADFADSRLVSRFVVSVPAEMVRPGVTAPALEAQLPEPSRQLFARRRTVDRLVLVDWSGSEEAGTPLDTLRDAMVKWDTAAYCARPVTLAGGYQMWLHTYPMLTTNPQARAPSTAPRQAEVPLSFEYPSLEEPTPPPAAGTAAAPSIDRSVKPSDPPAAGPSQPTVGDVDLDAATQRADDLLERIRNLRVRPSGGERLAWPPASTGNPALTQISRPQPASQPSSQPSSQSSSQPSKQPERAAGARSARPGVPSRALKPQLDESATRQLLELSKNRLEAERDWQRVRQSREQQLESEMRAQLQQKEEILLAEIQRLEKEQTAWEARQADLRADNEALRLRLAAYESPAAVTDGPAAESGSDGTASDRRLQELQAEQARVAEQLEAAQRARQRDQEREETRRRTEREAAARAEEDRRRRAEDEAKRKALEEEARRKRLEEEEARKRRLEEEEEAKRRKLAEEEANRARLAEEQAAEERRRRRAAAEEQRRLEEQERRLEEQERRQERRDGETHRAPLRGDGGGGGGRLKRSHSSPFIAGLGQEQAGAPAADRAPPAFSRETKPLVRTQRGDVQAARTRHFAPSYGSVAPALTGLKNLGNTCYMNAVVQCINNTPGLSEFFVNERYQDFINYDSELSRGEAAQELAAAVKVLWSGHYRSVALYDLKDVMGRHHGRFRGSAQQDAHEFLMYLLDFLHEDLNEVHRKQPLKEQENDGVPDARAAKLAWDDFKGSNRSFILNLFWGQHKSTLRCSRCGNQSVKFETFSHLSVPMPARSSRCSLSECIQLYMAGDTISGWTCPKCKSSIEATKRLDIWRLPPVLIIHIQRFYNDGLWRKKQSNVQFPLENLDMSPYVINKDARYRHHKYHLYGVVNHFGSMESGHYTAFCRAPNTGRWHKFDDHEVYQLNSGSVQSSAGYILFYSAIDGRL